jgi:hypothetical protein
VLSLIALASTLLAAATPAGGADRAVAAGVPAAVVQDLVARAAERGVDATVVLAPVIAAARAELPATLVAAKLLEGLAKGAPAERVLAVASALAERLGQSSALVKEARGRGLGLAGARDTALADLAGALGAGVPADAVRALVAAARSARGGTCDAVVAAARTLGELAQRGVPLSDAMPLALALAARPPVPAGEVATLYDAYRSEGGEDPRPFLEEATRRTATGVSLDGLVDHFGERPDRISRAGARDGSGAAGVNLREPTTAPGEAPGLGGAGRGRGRDRAK